jgi:hypothetical protein
MLSETSGDFADDPEHPERIPATTNASTLTDNLNVFMFSSEDGGHDLSASIPNIGADFLLLLRYCYVSPVT